MSVLASTTVSTSRPSELRGVFLRNPTELSGTDVSISGSSLLAMRSQMQQKCVEELASIRVMLEQIKEVVSRLPAQSDSTSQWLTRLREEVGTLETNIVTNNSAGREEAVLQSVKLLRCSLRECPSEHCSEQVVIVLARLNEISACQSRIKAVSDAPRLCADGLMRSKIYYIPPERLAAARNRRGLDPHLCEVAIIGAGPAGLSTAYSLGMRGIDTIVFDSYIAQGMSDARASAVHTMRTTAKGSCLFRAGLVPESIRSKAGFESLLAHTNLRDLAIQGRETITNLPESQVQNLNGAERHRQRPVMRNEVFAYFVEVAEQLAEMPNVMLLEQAPVTEPTWLADEGVFLIKSETGHEIRAKRLVVASGFVGREAQYSMMIPDLAKLSTAHAEHYVLIRDENDLTLHNSQLLRIAEDLSKQGYAREQIIVSDAVLGHPEIGCCISKLPADTSVAIVGSGESAAKAALEILRVNPSVKVQLFVKGKLEPSQGHTPFFSDAADPVVKSIVDSRYGDVTRTAWTRDFGTPITPESFLEIFVHVSTGRIRLFELGKHFSEQALDIELIDTGNEIVTNISIDRADTNVAVNLNRSLSEWRQCGLVTPDLVDSDRHLARINGPIVVAVGYDRVRMRHNDPVMAHLLRQGLIALKTGTGKGEAGEVQLAPNNFVSAKNPNLAFAGAVNLAGFADGSFSGCGVRGFLVGQLFADELRGEHSLADALAAKAFASTPSFITDLGHSPFPGNALLSDLAQRPEQSLSPQERLMLLRARQMQSRIDSALSAQGLR